MLALNVFEYALPETVGLFIFRYIPRLYFPRKKANCCGYAKLFRLAQ